MIARLFFVASVVVNVFAGPAGDKYPAGLDPNLCPNYPHCDNALLAAHSQPGIYTSGAHNGAYNGGYNEAYNSGAYVPGAYSGYANTGFASGGYAGFGNAASAYAVPGYPAGVNPATCPNYPYCTNYAPNAYHQVAPLPGFTHREYPEGVNPTTCPNYPFCH